MRKQRRASQREKLKQPSNSNNQGHVNTKFVMRKIEPITEMQEDMFDSYYDGFNLAAIGTAGTGKTMCALYLALTDVLEHKEYKQVIVIRSAVQTREQGFMPGTKEQKEALYSEPYVPIVNDLFGRGDAYEILRTKKLIKFTTTSFIRGMTFDNAIVIVDECQSMTFHELDTAMTRCGSNTKIIFCGDTRQDDLKTSRNRSDVSGLGDFLQVLDSMKSFERIQFTRADIVRSGLVKEYIEVKEDMGF